MDSDVSTTRTTVARSRGTFSVPSGWAHAKASATREHNDMKTARCRVQRRWEPITRPSTPVLVKRSAVRPLRRINTR